MTTYPKNVVKTKKKTTNHIASAALGLFNSYEEFYWWLMFLSKFKEAQQEQVLLHL